MHSGQIDATDTSLGSEAAGAASAVFTSASVGAASGGMSSTQGPVATAKVSGDSGWGGSSGLREEKWVGEAWGEAWGGELR